MPAQRISCLAASIALGLLVGIVTAITPHPITLNGVGVGDVGISLNGMEHFLAGDSPYGTRFSTYPFTAMLFMYPFTFLPLSLVAPLFLALSTSILSYAMLRNKENWRLLAFVSLPFLSALHSVQWAPLFTAALLLPGFLPIVLVKPQLGLVLLAVGKWNGRILAATCIFALLSLLMYPGWPLDWLRHGDLSSYDGRIPLLTGPGVLLLLAGLRWRDKRARLLLAMALVPQRLWYDQLLLFLIPRSFGEQGLLVAFSWLCALLDFQGVWQTCNGHVQPSVWPMTINFLYFPALAMVLWKGSVAGRTSPGQ